jgi:hypothetical protein
VGSAPELDRFTEGGQGDSIFKRCGAVAMGGPDAYAKLVDALEGALKIYKEVSAVDARASASGAVVTFLMEIGVETRLLLPLVDLATQNEYELQNRIGNTMPAPETYRLVLGSAAISAILERAKMNRTLNQISKLVANALGGIEAKALTEYRKALMAGRRSRDAKTLYHKITTEMFRPIFDAHPQGHDLEKFILLLIKDTPAGK